MCIASGNESWMKIKQKELDRAVTHSTLATSSPLMNSMQARNKKQNRVTLAPSSNQSGIKLDGPAAGASSHRPNKLMDGHGRTETARGRSESEWQQWVPHPWPWQVGAEEIRRSTLLMPVCFRLSNEAGHNLTLC